MWAWSEESSSRGWCRAKSLLAMQTPASCAVATSAVEGLLGQPVCTHQQLVESVLPLVVATGKAAAAARPANSVNLICGCE